MECGGAGRIARKHSSGSVSSVPEQAKTDKYYAEQNNKYGSHTTHPAMDHSSSRDGAVNWHSGTAECISLLAKA